jgi:filamentous hemagglutinin
MPPSKVTTPGPDYVTYNPIDDTIYVWDAKYRKEGGRYPCKGPSLEKVGAWMNQIRQAIERLSDDALRQKVLRALSRGRIRGELFKWP